MKTASQEEQSKAKMSKVKVNNTNLHQHQDNIANVLIAGDDDELTRFMLGILAQRGICGIVSNDKKKAIDFIENSSCDLVFISNRINERADTPNRFQDGFELLRKIKTNRPELPVIMVSSCENEQMQDKQRILETAVKAIREGCRDFLTRPLEGEKINSILDTLLPNHRVSTIASAYDATTRLYQIVGRSAKLTQAVELAKRVAPTSVPVLITGESGTGKELISYLIHQESRRANGPYIKVNCTALSDSLLESELFGHEKGAFTGAYSQRKGRFEMAHGGTLLLDEISETPMRFQAKLLRALEQQDFERVGGNENVRVDVRVISTTNKDLFQEVRQGRFRQDLYYRITGVRLLIPPLRERKYDLPDLVWHFINLYAREVQRRIKKIDDMMMGIFANYDWPGNVRQLRNAVRTSLILGAGETLSLADVSWLFDELQPLVQKNCSDFSKQKSNCESTGRLQNRTFEVQNKVEGSGLGGIPLEQIERQAILETLHQTAGNQTKAAKVLGISDRTLRDKIHKYRKEGCLQTI
jgi:DNA-binding NtrC family response regulator